MEDMRAHNLTDIFLNGSDWSNTSGRDIGPRTKSQTSFYVSLTLIWIPGLLANLLALFFIIRDIKKAMFPPVVLLLVLCSCDFIAICFSFTRHMIIRYVTDVTHHMCALLTTLHSHFKLFSGIMNVLMAVDRVMAICAPFCYKQHVNVNTWKRGCLLATVALAALNCFPLMGLGSYTGMRSTGEMYCTSLSFKTKPIERVYGLTYGFVGITCVILIVSLNVIVVRALLKLSSRIVSFAPSDSTGGDSSSSKVNQTSFEVAFAKLMLGLATVYLVCETPYNVSILLQQFRVPMDVNVISYIHLISGFSYTVDPVVYILIRKANRKSITDFFCRRKE